MDTAIKYPVPDRVKLSFVIFDMRALWRSGYICSDRKSGLNVYLVNTQRNCCSGWKRWEKKRYRISTPSSQTQTGHHLLSICLCC